MMNSYPYNLDDINDPFIERQASEHLRLTRFAEVNKSLLEFEPVEHSKIYPHPPTAYRIIYKIRSIVAIDQGEMPIYGHHHQMLIQLPENFPEQPAHCKMITDTWHPNIKSQGAFKGAICTNSAGFGSLFFLDELITRIGEFLQYKKYMAEERAPWPEDTEVAKWVREVGEPRGFIDKANGKFIDYHDWKLWDAPIETKEGEITISERMDFGDDMDQDQRENNGQNDDLWILEID
jgi:hypothetical protein